MLMFRGVCWGFRLYIDCTLIYPGALFLMTYILSYNSAITSSWQIND